MFTIMKYIFLILTLIFLSGCTTTPTTQQKKYYFPFEDELHEATWLQWPHKYEYGIEYQENVEPIWVEMTKGLIKGENVYIIVYNDEEKKRITNVLQEHNIDLTKIEFFIYPTNDVWVRDNGPIFVYDENNSLVISNWKFNGWGKKTNYGLDNKIPELISQDLNIEKVDVDVVLEGGSIEIDGNKTLMTTRSSVTNRNRNPYLSEEEIEEEIKAYYGVEQIIWLDGIPGLEITDFHIDGFLRFLDSNHIITMREEDLYEWGLSEIDYQRILDAKNIKGENYELIELPLTSKNVVLNSGVDLEYKGSYVNFYIANEVVLVPNYNDKNDDVANEIIQKLYPNREVIGIDVRELYQFGGMIHCVTQQQPIKLK